MARSVAILTIVWAICGPLSFQIGESFVRVLAQEFDYTDGPHGPASWGCLNTSWRTCSDGMVQSPIAIIPQIIVTSKKFKDLEVDYPHHAVPANISNNGHSVALKIPDGSVELSIKGEKYRSTQMHFHCPSEHTFVKYKFALEAHLVLISAAGKIAVVAWLITLGPVSPFFDQVLNTSLICITPFINNLPAYKEEYPLASPIKLLPIHAEHYGRYTGSLTTPPCTENVVWTVLLWNFPTVSQAQMKKLQAILKPNARPTQLPNGRKFVISSGHD
ncbi:alpha carbonic anhydrase 8 [Physcomitrium patens]|uniref:alpha carbonic anhydrase 8 n=1 Tax=Physcomitrium patens TaxID=3218 RepID=UPI003CCDFAAE